MLMKTRKIGTAKFDAGRLRVPEFSEPADTTFVGAGTPSNATQNPNRTTTPLAGCGSAWFCSGQFTSPNGGVKPPIDPLPKFAYLSGDFSNIILAMMTACFDASGHERDQRFLVVAGFVSSVDDWIDFDRLWRDRLAKDGL